MKKLYKTSYEQKKKIYGFLFMVPWIIGFLLFFAKPLLQSFLFSFSRVSMTETGLKMEFLGLEEYRYILFESAMYVDNIGDSVTAFLYQIPIIFILSYIVAVVLNGKFRGRAFFRSIFFVPVIITTGVVMQYIKGDPVMEAMRGAESSSIYLSGLIDFNEVFNDLGIPQNIGNIIFGYVEDIFNLVWNSGIQIVLFISGLQSIPEQLYEVSKVEGATKWEEFWYITTPMMSTTINLVLCFTAIDFCMGESNKVMKQAYTVLTDDQNYGQSSAMMWLFFAGIGILFGIVLLLINKKIFKKLE